MPRPRNKKMPKGGRGHNRFHAESASEIEQRNQRLTELDDERALRRQDSDEEDEGKDNENGDKEVKSLEKVTEKVESRKERDQRQKAEAYRKRHEAGLTDEYKKDMERLAEVRRRREALSAQKEQVTEESVEAERARVEKFKLLEKEVKKSSKSKEIPKLDKITIKKMKPQVMKDALKERGLEIQGNNKALTARLLEYEGSR
mmetsp:Transcript_11324/g.16632  ORF Transcript_11324/g.16632 Transcript_11324/m.16632 type:complete len:202 (+) Transcript_11324:105-710(+)|eukprot:CAMPEP_0194210964 /NCGR_PEP_ID=MMETSP0156-20130528/9210_1 /TAXON_ID=33649 /ORGANISM="Thalassionema nitzschioides, Strain L26-B" /LENGTH=201 /DNA_ID=CAMNT_0038938383 /DNA_START=86 /DNA_END=688 /DNA_ORIENTATION=+